jgi:hypothetical protein
MCLKKFHEAEKTIICLKSMMANEMYKFMHKVICDESNNEIIGSFFC